jgi:hypothetical protein
MKHDGRLCAERKDIATGRLDVRPANLQIQGVPPFPALTSRGKMCGDAHFAFSARLCGKVWHVPYFAKSISREILLAQAEVGRAQVYPGKLVTATAFPAPKFTRVNFGTILAFLVKLGTRVPNLRWLPCVITLGHLFAFSVDAGASQEKKAPEKPVVGSKGSAQAQQPPRRQRPRQPLFLKTERTRLVLGQRLFRNVGVNIPDLFERFLRGEEESAKAALHSAQLAGVRFVRCWGTTWGAEGFGTFEKEPTRWFAAFDRMLEVAAAERIRVVPSLLFNPNMIPDYVRRMTGREEHIVDYLKPGSASNALAVRYVTAIVERYKNEPRVLFWEIGNEYNLEADLSAQHKPRPANQIPTSDHIRDFLVQIATLIKRLDKNHLVTSGNADMRPAAWHLRQAMLANREKPNPHDYPMDWRKDSFRQYAEMLAFFNPLPLDIISVHQYPPGKETPDWIVENDDYAFVLPWTRTASDEIGRPLFVGEFAQKIFEDGKENRGLWTRDFLKRMEMDSAPVGALWAWDFRPDDPSQAPYSLSPARTPGIIRVLGEVNALILTAVTADAATRK